MGIAFYPEESTDTNKLIKIVDDLLYAYKKQGKNKVSSTMILRCEPPIPLRVDVIDINNKTIGVISIYDGG